MSNRDLMESKKKDSVYNNGNINLDAIGELIENSLANCFDNDDKKKLYQERFSNIYKQVLSSCLADNHDLLEDLCAEIVVIEQSLL